MQGFIDGLLIEGLGPVVRSTGQYQYILAAASIRLDVV